MHLNTYFIVDCVIPTSMSSAIEVLLNIADTVIINTAKITEVNLHPLEDGFFIYLPLS